MEKLNIAIVGAGLGGLAAANLLLKGGHSVRVYEQAPAIGEVGAGISLPPNAAKIVAAMGLGERLKEISNIPQEGRIHHGETGEVIKVSPFGETVKDNFGDYYYQMHRADLIDILLEGVRAIDPDCVQTGHSFVSYEEDEDGVTLNFEGQPSQKADLLIGADGVRSRIRGQMCGPEKPIFTGYVAWRALIPLDRLPADYAQPFSNVWIEKGRNVTFYPIRGTSLLNCAMFASDSTWTEEGWNIPAKISDIREAYANYHERVQTVIDAISEDMCFQWALYGREPTKQWVSGRVVLMGDAAHPMLPFLGQGASMAFEDGALLAASVNSQRSITDALALYLEHREERANWVLMESRAAGERFVAENPTGDTFGKDGAMQMGRLFGYEVPDFK